VNITLSKQLVSPDSLSVQSEIELTKERENTIRGSGDEALNQIHSSIRLVSGEDKNILFEIHSLWVSKWTIEEKENVCNKDPLRPDIAPHYETN